MGMTQRFGGPGWVRVIVALAVLLGIGQAVAQGASAPAGAPPALPAELFFKPPDIIDARLSPSGLRLAVSTNAGGNRVGLQVVELDGSNRIHLAAHFTDVDVAAFDWVNDERLVFSTVNLAEGSGRQARPGLLSVRFDGEEMRMLIARRGRPLALLGPGVRKPALSFNHVLLHIPTQPGDEVVVGEYRGSATETDSLLPMRLNVVTGRTRSMPLKAPEHTVEWLFDPAGDARVAITRKDGRRGVHWRAPGQDEWQLLAESGELIDVPFEPLLVDGKGTLYVTRTEGPAGHNVLTRWDFAAGRPDPVPLVSAPGFDFIGQPLVGGDGSLWGFHVSTDIDTTVWLNDELAQLQKLADARMPGYVNRLIRCRRCLGADKVVVVQSRSDRDPGHLWLYREPAGGPPRWQLIGRHKVGLDARRMASVDFQRIRSRDGRDLPVWLTIPPGRKAGDGGPAVVLVHGGPWVRGGHWRWQPLEQYLASRGYVVVAPEFRGSTGYGRNHFVAGMGQWGQAMQDDVADAARWALSRGWADRLCIAGGGYGGYSALMGLARDGDLFRCGVAWSAITDLMLYLRGSWLAPDNVSDSAREFHLPVLVGDPERDAERLRAGSPLEQAARIRRPVLLAYGGVDRRVPLEHGTRLRKALREAGSEPEWVVYEDEAHAWLKPETHIDFARRLEDFLGRHLK